MECGQGSQGALHHQEPGLLLPEALGLQSALTEKEQREQGLTPSLRFSAPKGEMLLCCYPSHCTPSTAVRSLVHFSMRQKGCRSAHSSAPAPQEEFGGSSGREF